MNPRISIIIPSYNHVDDLLKPCINSIIHFTDMSNVEIIVVANGCTDGTKEYLESMPPFVVALWSNEALGYTKATNLGIRHARGEYVVLMNNDCVLLAPPAVNGGAPPAKNLWLDLLEAPYKSDRKVGCTGPLMLHDDYADRNILIFFCVMIPRKVLDEVSLLAARGKSHFPLDSQIASR